MTWAQPKAEAALVPKPGPELPGRYWGCPWGHVRPGFLLTWKRVRGCRRRALSVDVSLRTGDRTWSGSLRSPVSWPEAVWSRPGPRPRSAPCAWSWAPAGGGCHRSAVRTHAGEGPAHGSHLGSPQRLRCSSWSRVGSPPQGTVCSTCCLAKPFVAPGRDGAGLHRLRDGCPGGFSPHPAEAPRSPFICKTDTADA